MKKIAAKLVKVMEEVSYVKKNGTNTFHHYSYATSADVLEKINAAFVKNNLCSIVDPKIISSENMTTNKGNAEHLVTVRLNIMIIDGESGEMVTITGIGSGQDSGDKAVMKAQTAAIKYAYLMSMAISTGDDPELSSDGNSTSLAKPKANEPIPMPEKSQYICANCGTALSKGVFTVSGKKYGKPLCMKCQQKIIKSA